MQSIGIIRKLARGGVAAIAFVSCASGCKNNDTECLARVARKVAAKSEAIQFDDRLAPLLVMRDGVSVEKRVAERIRWDKLLDGCSISVRIHDDLIEIEGEVAIEEQRKRVLELAEGTVGVTRVDDRLKIASVDGN
jgi:osmotically-inducible protein OsmY